VFLLVPTLGRYSVPVLLLIMLTPYRRYLTILSVIVCAEFFSNNSIMKTSRCGTCCNHKKIYNEVNVPPMWNRILKSIFFHECRLAIKGKMVQNHNRWTLMHTVRETIFPVWYSAGWGFWAQITNKKLRYSVHLLILLLAGFQRTHNGALAGGVGRLTDLAVKGRHRGRVHDHT
jgi:hypothetical protein